MHLPNIIHKWLLLGGVFLVFSTTPLLSKTVLEVAAIVNDQVITSLDIALYRQRLPKLKGIAPQNLKNDNMILDYLINHSLIDQIAQRETIRASEDKVDERIQALLKANNLKTKEELDTKLKSRGASLEMFETEIRKQLLLFQVMQLSMQVKPPTENEIKAWYEQNKNKLGLEMNLNVLALNFNPNSIKDERAVNKRINGIRNQIANKSISFYNAAKKYSQGPYKANGGATGWINLMELDPMVANMAFSMKNRRSGTLSQIFKGMKKNQYFIIQINGSRIIPLQAIEQRIFALLYAQKQEKEMEKWLKRQRDQAIVQVFLPSYSGDKSVNSSDNTPNSKNTTKPKKSRGKKRR